MVLAFGSLDLLCSSSLGAIRHGVAWTIEFCFISSYYISFALISPLPSRLDDDDVFIPDRLTCCPSGDLDGVCVWVLLHA
jgi:hypothetical protein